MDYQSLVQPMLYASKSANAILHRSIEENPTRLQKAVIGSAHSRLPTRLAALNFPRLLEPAGLHSSALLALQKVLESFTRWYKLNRLTEECSLYCHCP